MSRSVVLFWSIVIALIALDYRSAPEVYRVEPPAVALGSGDLPTGGHCSGR